MVPNGSMWASTPTNAWAGYMQNRSQGINRKDFRQKACQKAVIDGSRPFPYLQNLNRRLIGRFDDLDELLGNEGSAADEVI